MLRLSTNVHVGYETWPLLRVGLYQIGSGTVSIKHLARAFF